MRGVCFSPHPYLSLSPNRGFRFRFAYQLSRLMKQQFLRRGLERRSDPRQLAERGVLRGTQAGMMSVSPHASPAVSPHVGMSPAVSPALQPRLHQLMVAMRQALLQRQLRRRKNIQDVRESGVMRGRLW